MRVTSVHGKLSGEGINAHRSLVIQNIIFGFRIRLTPDARAIVDSAMHKL